MTNDSDEAILVRLSITKEPESPKDIAERLGEERTYGLISAALGVAVARRFGDTTSVEDIDRYVTALRERFPDADDILKPTVTQAVIRTARGEEDLLEGLSHDDVGTLLFFLVYAIMTEQTLDEADTDIFVDEVLAMADNS